VNKKIRRQFACSRLMLPEHCSSLERHYKETEQSENCRRPLLDEQEQDRFQQILQRSLGQNAPLALTVLKENGFRHLTGTVIKLEPWAGCLRLRTDAAVETVRIAEITGVEAAGQKCGER
jgi:3-methyladenine DNA glycosylase AlkC